MLFKEIVDGRTHGRTDDRRGTLKDHKSSLSTSCSGELKSTGRGMKEVLQNEHDRKIPICTGGLLITRWYQQDINLRIY